MKIHYFLLLVFLLLPNSTYAEGAKNYPIAKVNFNDFKTLVSLVEHHRRERLIDLDTFLKMSKEPGVVILDSRSAFRYNRIHLKDAKHLNFADFTQSSLAELIPDRNTKILIYCNNNFEGNEQDFPSKIGPIFSSLPNRADPKPGSEALTRQLYNQSKPMMMALNVPTYINLYGYGYHNVYELHELVDINDPRIKFEGTILPSPPN